MTHQQIKYFICQERGHVFRGGEVFDTNPPFYTCSSCGTTYRVAETTHEALTPFGWKSDPETASKIEAARQEFMEMGKVQS